MSLPSLRRFRRRRAKVGERLLLPRLGHHTAIPSNYRNRDSPANGVH